MGRQTGGMLMFWDASCGGGSGPPEKRGCREANNKQSQREKQKKIPKSALQKKKGRRGALGRDATGVVF